MVSAMRDRLRERSMGKRECEPKIVNFCQLLSGRSHFKQRVRNTLTLRLRLKFSTGLADLTGVV